ncbi:Uncharacterised protein [Yersinia nurmii]|uniref:Uncharacterized protein n=1 Tax=Yersinia nurmii TaxID=685706 RepID=A0ABM9S148_9GAMM|nr:Uncharacterised protein [Yersinia nurmii]
MGFLMSIFTAIADMKAPRQYLFPRPPAPDLLTPLNGIISISGSASPLPTSK